MPSLKKINVELKEEIMAETTRVEDHPDIAKALAEGWTLADCQNGRNAAQRMRSKIQNAGYRYGKSSPQVQEAIDEANRVSAMLTTARAAYNRIDHPELYGLPARPPETPSKAVESAMVAETPEAPTEPSGWRAVWSKEPYDKYRELQNIPDHWELRKVVLIWFGDGSQRLRVFSLQRGGYQTKALIELTGNGDLLEVNAREGRWDFVLTREEYDAAASATYEAEA